MSLENDWKKFERAWGGRNLTGSKSRQEFYDFAIRTAVSALVHIAMNTEPVKVDLKIE